MEKRTRKSIFKSSRVAVHEGVPGVTKHSVTLPGMDQPIEVELNKKGQHSNQRQHNNNNNNNSRNSRNNSRNGNHDRGSKRTTDKKIHKNKESCRLFNSAEGCKRKECRFDHFCTKCKRKNCKKGAANCDA